MEEEGISFYESRDLPPERYTRNKIMNFKFSDRVDVMIRVDQRVSRSCHLTLSWNRRLSVMYNEDERSREEFSLILIKIALMLVTF